MKLLLVIVALFFVSTVTSQPCVPPNGGAAVSVIGAPDFTTIAGGASTSQTLFPYDISIDETTGKVFVVDTGNNRILRFTYASAFLNGQAAEAVFGGLGCTATGLNNPSSVVVHNGVCYIADTFNHRVVRLDNCVNAAAGTAWNFVFGASTLTVCNPGSTLAGFNFPLGVTVDFLGNLYVSDNNGLVYKFPNAATAATPGVVASVTLGLNGTFACGANTFGQPIRLEVDPFTGTLWVSDAVCHRVVVFNQVHLKASAANADFVIGQASLTGFGPGCSANNLNVPQGLSYDGNSNTLFVADASNNRVLYYTNAVPATLNPAAAGVLGQATLAACAANPASASSLFDPRGVLYDYDTFPNPSLNLLVADTNNNRVLRFSCAASNSPSNTNSWTPSHSNSNSWTVSNSASSSLPPSVSSSTSLSGSRSTSLSNSRSNTWTSSNSASNTASTTESLLPSPSRSPITCGNGVVDSTAEQCDPGAGRFGKSSCCNNQCRFKTLDHKCGPRPPVCKTWPRCKFDAFTGVFACSASKNKLALRGCKTSAIPDGVCDGAGNCVPRV